MPSFIVEIREVHISRRLVEDVKDAEEAGEVAAGEGTEIECNYCCMLSDLSGVEDDVASCEEISEGEFNDLLLKHSEKHPIEALFVSMKNKNDN